MTEPTEQVLDALSSSGLLLQQDKRFPNVVTLVTGKSLSGSWWSHSKGRLIFAVLSELSDHPDVLFTKLLYRKVTLVQRQLWPALLAVVSAGEPWQLHGLSTAGQRLLTSVNHSKAAVQCSGPVVKELEFRLLAHTQEVHTSSGRHATALEPWSVWRRRVGVKPLRSATLGRQSLEKAARTIGIPHSAFPWSSAKSTAT